MHGTREKPGRPGESHHAVMNAIRFFVAGVELVIPSPELWTFGWQNQGPCQSVSSRYGTHWGSTLEPGIRGRWRYTYEKWLQSGRRRRCADIQRLPGCPVGLTLNGRARPVPGPTRLSRSATVHTRRLAMSCWGTLIAVPWCCDL